MAKLSNYIECTADFETTTEATYKLEGRVRVWAWQIRRIDNEKVLATGNSIETFFEFISKQSLTLYFHNLKFDGTFIVDYMLRNGYKFTNEKLNSHEFNWLVDDMGQWYSITILHKRLNKKVIKTKILDSLKILNFSVDTIAKKFLNQEVEKLELDYNKYRPIGHELTHEELKYLNNDTLIMAKALKLTHEMGLTKMTAASNAYNDFKEGLKNYVFDYQFPELDTEEDAHARKSYKGGFVYVQEGKACKEFTNVTTYDVNSLFPSVMYNEKLPFGKGIKFKGKPKKEMLDLFPLFIIHISCIFELKPEHIPTIQIKKSTRFIETEYLKSSNYETVDLYLTSVDLKLFFEHYNVHSLKWYEGYYYRAKSGMFCNYIDKWYAIKKNETGAKREFAKLMLNSLYGKFGSKIEKKVTRAEISDKDCVKVGLTGETEHVKPKYIPIATFITAYARYKTISSAQKIYKDFIYADTDSLHTTASEEEVKSVIEVDQSKLGAWKNEGTALRAKFLRPKTYIKDYGDKFEVKCAGLPKDLKEKVNWDEFKRGATFHGKLATKKVKGGTLLSPTDFTIKL